MPPQVLKQSLNSILIYHNITFTKWFILKIATPSRALLLSCWFWFRGLGEFTTSRRYYWHVWYLGTPRYVTPLICCAVKKQSNILTEKVWLVYTINFSWWASPRHHHYMSPWAYLRLIPPDFHWRGCFSSICLSPAPDYNDDHEIYGQWFLESLPLI